MQCDITYRFVQFQFEFVGADQMLPILLFWVLEDQLALFFVEDDTALFKVDLAAFTDQTANMRMFVCQVVEVYAIFGLQEQPFSGSLL